MAHIFNSKYRRKLIQRRSPSIRCVMSPRHMAGCVHEQEKYLLQLWYQLGSDHELVRLDVQAIQLYELAPGWMKLVTYSVLRVRSSSSPASPPSPPLFSRYPRELFPDKKEPVLVWWARRARATPQRSSHVGRRPFPFGHEHSETAKLFITVTGQSFRTIGPLSTRSYNYFSFDPGKNDTNDTNLMANPDQSDLWRFLP
jgi:hypothetical protein